ncbi:MAG: glycosyltransferase [Actinobacteria bacterium]|nr:glycosyltransferase [Actinomycetota bacterium]
MSARLDQRTGCRPSLAPIVARLDGVGLIEHAVGSTPSPTSGHCADDAGRALAVAARMRWDPDAVVVIDACLGQLERSLRPDGTLALRLDEHGRPTDDPSSDDAHGRAVWGAALASTACLPTPLGARATRLFATLSRLRTAHLRAAAHAVVAAGVVLRRGGDAAPARELLESCRPFIPPPSPRGDWPWPEPRLSYGNGLVVEAMLTLADLDHDRVARGRALDLLRWLVAHERSPAGHFSFTPVGGRGPGEPGGFDQQPIEAWALAEACAAAQPLDHRTEWASVCGELDGWFDGRNDRGVVMWDRATGGAYDGLTPTGPNTNEGTESTLALIGTRWVAWRVGQRLADRSRSSRR